METIKLYDDYPYEKEFSAVVVAVKDDALILDQTLFFPEEGGQTPDRGTINGVKVKDVQIDHGVIMHSMEKNAFQVGDHVNGQIDWAYRFSNMQNHTGEHIFSGLAHKHYGYDNVGFHLGDHEMTVDLNGPLDHEQLRALENEVNQAIYENVKVTCRYVGDQDLATLDYRSKKEINEAVRIVTIEGYDVCACCAPHVKRTGEVGLFKIISAMNYKGGVRVSALCGKRALNYLQRDFDHLEILYKLLSANQDSIVKYVTALEEKSRQLESELKQVTSQALESRVQGMHGDPDLILFEQDVETNIQRHIVNEMMEKASGKAGFFVGNDQQGYRYIIGSKHENMQDFLKTFKAIGAKGGGSPQMITGFIKQDQATIASYFQVK